MVCIRNVLVELVGWTCWLVGLVGSYIWSHFCGLAAEGAAPTLSFQRQDLNDRISRIYTNVNIHQCSTAPSPIHSSKINLLHVTYWTPFNFGKHGIVVAILQLLVHSCNLDSFNPSKSLTTRYYFWQRPFGFFNNSFATEHFLERISIQSHFQKSKPPFCQRHKACIWPNPEKNY